jgi:thioredoxin reductase (NADPH)
MDDLIIIGAGPAGLTAALYAGRAKLKTKVLERDSLGGQVLLTGSIENFPGVYQMNSSDWIEVIKRQLADLKEVEIQEGITVEKIEPKGNFFKIHSICQNDGAKNILETRGVIIATGAQPKRLGVKGEKELTGHGVSYCATCDGPFFKGKEVVLVGGGDTALEEALYLRKFAKKVTIVHRRNVLRATAILQERVKNDDKIRLKLEAVPLEILGTTRVSGIKIKNIQNNTQESLPCDGVFVFVGFLPATDFLKGLLKLNDKGSIVTDETMLSSCAGIFACGDSRARPFHQVVTACAEGAIAAFSVNKFLSA